MDKEHESVSDAFDQVHSERTDFAIEPVNLTANSSPLPEPKSPWVLGMSFANERQALAASISSGLVGLGGSIFLMAIVFPFLTEALNDRPTESLAFSTSLMCVFMLSPMSIVCVILGCSALWNSGLMQRIGILMILLVPATFAIVFQSNADPGDWLMTWIFILPTASGTMSVSVINQLYSSRVLTPVSIGKKSRHKLDVITLMALTTLIAVSAGLIQASTPEGGFASFLSLFIMSTIYTLIGTMVVSRYLRTEMTGKWFAIICTGLTFLLLGTFFYVIFVQVQRSAYLALVPTLVGTLAVVIPIAMCITWLRACGWRCDKI